MKTFSVFNPATGQEISQVPDQGQEETIAAIEAAHEGFRSWSRLPIKRRAEILKKWHTLTLEQAPRLAQLLHEEQGKPLEEAMEEILDGILFFEWSVADVQRVHGYTAQSPDPKQRMMTLKQPVGVVAVITPWNFPSTLPLQKCIPALACGCSVILKPSEETPLSALEHQRLAKEAGIPDGVFTVLTSKEPTAVGQTLLDHPLVRKVSFTGSTEVGKKLFSMAGKTVKKLSLELGGNCPFLLFDDGDVDLAVDMSCGLKFYNCGQVCNNINRFLIHEKVYDTFIDKFHTKMQTLVLGPLNNAKVTEKIVQLLEDAKKKGAKILGGQRNGLYITPALLTDLNPQMEVYRTEIFGPVACLYPFSSEEEAVQMANDTEYGLAAYLFTSDADRQWRVAEALEAGSVGVNTTNVYSKLLPFGGWKQSGLGRELGLENALDQFLETKSVVFSMSPSPLP